MPIEGKGKRVRRSVTRGGGKRHKAFTKDSAKG